MHCLIYALYVPSILGFLLGLDVSCDNPSIDESWLVLTESSNCGEELIWDPGDST